MFEIFIPALQKNKYDQQHNYNIKFLLMCHCISVDPVMLVCQSQETFVSFWSFTLLEYHRTVYMKKTVCMCGVVTFTSLDLDSENIWETSGNKARGSKREMQMRQLDMFVGGFPCLLSSSLRPAEQTNSRALDNVPSE